MHRQLLQQCLESVWGQDTHHTKIGKALWHASCVFCCALPGLIPKGYSWASLSNCILLKDHLLSLRHWQCMRSSLWYVLQSSVSYPCWWEASPYAYPITHKPFSNREEQLEDFSVVGFQLYPLPKGRIHLSSLLMKLKTEYEPGTVSLRWRCWRNPFCPTDLLENGLYCHFWTQFYRITLKILHKLRINLQASAVPSSHSSAVR